MADWWMQSGATSTAPGANAPLTLGTAAITTAELAAGAVAEAAIASGAVTVTKLGALSVTSEKASANLVKRTVVTTFGSTFGTGYASTGIPIWTAPTASVISAIRLTPMTPWNMATCGETLTFWSCVAGIISLYCTSSTGTCKTVGNVNSCFTLKSTGVNLAACETLRLVIAISASSCAQVGAYQVDYVTSG